MVSKERTLSEQEKDSVFPKRSEDCCVEFECEVWRNPTLKQMRGFSIIFREREREKKRESRQKCVFIFCP